MSATQVDGDTPAFPCPRYVNADGETISLSDKRGENGLTKRELLAAMAMQGCLAAEADMNNPSATPDGLARWCVLHADALLLALQEPLP